MFTSMTEPEMENEKILCDFFRKKYNYLRKQNQDFKDISWKSVLKDVDYILNEFKKIKDQCLTKFKNNQDLFLSEKLSVNCVSITLKIFCKKFDDIEIDIDITNITEKLRENIKDFLPYLSKGILAVRMIEIMLYAMCTVCEEFKDFNGQWSTLTIECFHHSYATEEIKLAASVLLCNIDKTKEYIQRDMFAYLNQILYNENLFGFKEKDIKWSIIQVQDYFPSSFSIKEYRTQERDSGYKSQEETLEDIRQRRAFDLPEKEIVKDTLQKFSIKKVLHDSLIPIVIGLVFGMLLLWVFKR